MCVVFNTKSNLKNYELDFGIKLKLKMCSLHQILMIPQLLFSTNSQNTCMKLIVTISMLTTEIRCETYHCSIQTCDWSFHHILLHPHPIISSPLPYHWMSGKDFLQHNLDQHCIGLDGDNYSLEWHKRANHFSMTV